MCLSSCDTDGHVKQRELCYQTNYLFKKGVKKEKKKASLPGYRLSTNVQG